MTAEAFVVLNQKYFTKAQLPHIQQALAKMTESQIATISTVKYKSPVVSFLLAFFLGGFGADKYYVGKTGTGVLKLCLSCIVVGSIWCFIDWFRAGRVAKNYNFEQFVHLSSIY